MPSNIPMYVFTGFLESGKTKFIQETLLAVCGKNAVASGIKAGDIIRNIAPIVGGKGGGKPDSAMGGGTNALKLDDALAAVDDFVAEHLK